METKVFILKSQKTYSRGVKIYIPKGNKEGVIAKTVQFTTAHLISAKDRTSNGRAYNAEYKTSDPYEIESLMSSDGYGKVYTLKNDPEGKLKMPNRNNMTNDDLRKAALKSLFDDAGMKFDNTKSFAELKAEYSGGSKSSNAMQISVEKVNVSMGIAQAKAEARAKFVDKYGMEVPDHVKDDITFLDGLSNPDFDAMGYIELSAGKSEGDPKELSQEELIAKYQEIYGKLPPNTHKNNIEWLKGKVSEQ